MYMGGYSPRLAYCSTQCKHQHVIIGSLRNSKRPKLTTSSHVRIVEESKVVEQSQN